MTLNKETSEKIQVLNKHLQELSGLDIDFVTVDGAERAAAAQRYGGEDG